MRERPYGPLPPAMTLFARQDIQMHMSGTTGHLHKRPLKADNTPVPVWGIDCPPCEAELAGHPAWARSRYKIPLTPDEQEEAAMAQAAAEQALHQQQLMLAQQAIVAQMTAKNAAPQIDPEDVAISSGDDSDDAPVTNVGGPPANDESVLASNYGGHSKNDLKDLARERGLAVGGTRDDLVARHVQYDMEGTDS